MIPIVTLPYNWAKTVSLWRFLFVYVRHVLPLICLLSTTKILIFSRNYSFNNSLVRSQTFSFTYSFTCSLMDYARTYTLSRSLTNLLTHSLIHSLTHYALTRSYSSLTHVVKEFFYSSFIYISSKIYFSFLCLCVLVRMCLQVFASVLDCTAKTLTLKTDHIAFVVNYVSFIPSMETDAHPRSPIEFVCNTTALVSGL